MLRFQMAGLAPSWPAGVARDGKSGKTAPTEAIGSIVAGDREGKEDHASAEGTDAEVEGDGPEESR
jgi:hypothetical protein